MWGEGCLAGGDVGRLVVRSLRKAPKGRMTVIFGKAERKLRRDRILGR